MNNFNNFGLPINNNPFVNQTNDVNGIGMGNNSYFAPTKPMDYDGYFGSQTKKPSFWDKTKMFFSQYGSKIFGWGITIFGGLGAFALGKKFIDLDVPYGKDEQKPSEDASLMVKAKYHLCTFLSDTVGIMKPYEKPTTTSTPAPTPVVESVPSVSAFVPAKNKKGIFNKALDWLKQLINKKAEPAPKPVTPAVEHAPEPEQHEPTGNNIDTLMAQALNGDNKTDAFKKLQKLANISKEDIKEMAEVALNVIRITNQMQQAVSQEEEVISTIKDLQKNPFNTDFATTIFDKIDMKALNFDELSKLITSSKDNIDALLPIFENMNQEKQIGDKKVSDLVADVKKAVAEDDDLTLDQPPASAPVVEPVSTPVPEPAAPVTPAPKPVTPAPERASKPLVPQSGIGLHSTGGERRVDANDGATRNESASLMHQELNNTLLSEVRAYELEGEGEVEGEVKGDNDTLLQEQQLIDTTAIRKSIEKIEQFIVNYVNPESESVDNQNENSSIQCADDIERLAESDAKKILNNIDSSEMQIWGYNLADLSNKSITIKTNYAHSLFNKLKDNILKDKSKANILIENLYPSTSSLIFLNLISNNDDIDINIKNSAPKIYNKFIINANKYLSNDDNEGIFINQTDQYFNQMATEYLSMLYFDGTNKQDISAFNNAIGNLNDNLSFMLPFINYLVASNCEEIKQTITSSKTESNKLKHFLNIAQEFKKNSNLNLVDELTQLKKLYTNYSDCLKDISKLTGYNQKTFISSLEKELFNATETSQYLTIFNLLRKFNSNKNTNSSIISFISFLKNNYTIESLEKFKNDKSKLNTKLAFTLPSINKTLEHPLDSQKLAEMCNEPSSELYKKINKLIDIAINLKGVK